MFATFDYTRFPKFVVVKFQGVPDSQTEFDTFIANFQDMYRKKIIMSLIFDARNIQWIPMNYLFQLASFMKVTAPLAKQYLQKSAIIVTSPLMQVGLDMLFQMQPPMSLTKTFTDKKDALRWIFNMTEEKD